MFYRRGPPRRDRTHRRVRGCDTPTPAPGTRATTRGRPGGGTVDDEPPRPRDADRPAERQPVFQTTTGDIGQDFRRRSSTRRPPPAAPPRRTLVDNYDFGFLYEKMSDDIGAGQHHAPSAPRAMGAQDTPAQPTRRKTMGAPASAATIAAAESRPAADRVERILDPQARPKRSTRWA